MFVVNKKQIDEEVVFFGGCWLDQYSGSFMATWDDLDLPFHSDKNTSTRACSAHLALQISDNRKEILNVCR